MGMYNLLFGENSKANELKALLGLDQVKIEIPDEPDERFVNQCVEDKIWPTGRYRDIYVADGKIILYTRNGGGNRDDYWWVFEILKQHPNYIADYDDDFDNTYASIEFSIPSTKQIMRESERGGRLFKQLFDTLNPQSD